MRVRIDLNSGQMSNMMQCAMIYRILNKGSSDYAVMLHDTGYLWRGKPYRGFVFSPVQYKPNGQPFFIISSPLQLFCKYLIQGLLSSIQDVAGFEILSKAVYTTNGQYVALSPICVRERKKYLVPGHDKIAQIEGIIKGGLLNRMCAFRDLEKTCELSSEKGSDFEIRLDVDYILAQLSFGKKIISQHQIHGSFFQGFQCPVKIKAKYPLREYIALMGIGSRTSLGFGYLVPKTRNKKHDAL